MAEPEKGADVPSQPPPAPPTPDPLEAARRALQEDVERRRARCRALVEQALREQRMELVVRLVTRDAGGGGITVQVGAVDFVPV